MKIHILFFLLLISVSSVRAQKVMPYRIVTVSNSQWCDPRQKEAVEKEIDKIADCGFNVIDIGSFKFMPTWFLDYENTDYPEACQFSQKKVAQNVETIRSNMRYAKKKGLKIVSASYSNYAPANFWKAHQKELNPDGIYDRLLKESHQNDLYKRAMTGKGDVVQAQQWANPYFKEFFVYSTRLMLDALPELDGFLNAYAESAWTYDENKLREDTWKSWKECVNYAKTNDDFVDYGNTLNRILKEKRGDDFLIGLRDWYVKPADLKRMDIDPAKLIVSVKYAGYDQPLVNYPLWAKDLLDAGFCVLLDIHVYDAENPHPLYWYDNQFDHQMIRNAEEAGFPGIVYHDFTAKSKGDLQNPVRLLTQKTIGSILNHKKFDEKDAVAFLKPYYGAASASLLESMKAVTRSQEARIKLMPAWFWQGDGLTPGGLSEGRFWKYKDDPGAPAGMEFVRQGVVSVLDYSQAIIDNNLDQKKKEWKSAGRTTPLEAIGQMQKDADAAIEAALKARKEKSPKDTNKEEIIASAIINKLVIQRDAAFTRSAIAYFASGGQYDGKYCNDYSRLNTGVDQTDICLKEMEESVYRDLIMRELCRKYAPRRPEMRSAKGYDFSKRVAKVCGKKLTVPQITETDMKPFIDLIENK